MSLEDITDEKWMDKIQGRVIEKRVREMLGKLFESVEKAEGQHIKFIEPIFKDETAMKEFVRVLVAMDAAEFASGNHEKHRPFLSVAGRIAFVFYMREAKGAPVLKVE